MYSVNIIYGQLPELLDHLNVFSGYSMTVQKDLRYVRVELDIEGVTNIHEQMWVIETLKSIAANWIWEHKVVERVKFARINMGFDVL